MAKKVEIDSIRPLWQIVDENYYLMKTGSYACFYELELPSIYTLDQDDYDRLNSDFSRIFNLLPEYAVVHKLDIFTNSFYNKKFDNDENSNLLSSSYFKKHLEKPFVKHKSYLFISKTHNGFIKQSSLSSLIFKRNFIPKELINNNDFENFKECLSRIESVIQTSQNISLRKLPISEGLELIDKYESLSFNENKHTSNIYQDLEKTIIGDKHISAVSINSLECLPNTFRNTYVDSKLKTDTSSIPFSLFYPIGLDLSFDHIVNQIFIKSSKETVKEELRKTDSMNRTFYSADPGNEQNLNDSMTFVDYLEKGYVPIHYHANVITWDQNKKTLAEKVNTIFAGFTKINITPNIGFNEILPLFWSCYPGNASDIGYIDQTFLLLDKEAASLNILETTSKSSNSHFGIYLNDRSNGVPLFVDISDKPKEIGLTHNRNKIIIGPSGSGKSFTTNHLINSYLNFNTDVVIVDVGGSYERLCKLRGGRYLEYTEDKPISFNPFFILKEDNNIEKRETLMTLIFTLWKKQASDASKEEQAILTEGLNAYYDNVSSDTFMCFNSFFEFMTKVYFPSLKETPAYSLINVASFETVLKMYYKGGAYDYLLNSEVNIDLFYEDFIVFELDNIKDHPVLFPVVSLMIMDVFITKMRFRKNRRKIILIEEAWKAIAKDGFANFMVYLYKTVRKFFGEAWIVTQELDDIINSEIVRNTIIKNCGAKILLDMNQYINNFDEIQSLLSLSNKTKNLVLSLNQNLIPGPKYKEVFIGLGTEGEVYGVNLSKEEYAVYTTEKLEKERIQDLEKEYGSLEMAIKIFAEEL